MGTSVNILAYFHLALHAGVKIMLNIQFCISVIFLICPISFFKVFDFTMQIVL